jgi:hypothetical protein
VKLTSTPFANHTFQGNFTTNPTTEALPAIGGFEIDPATLITRRTPNDVFGANWRGVLGSKLFAEAAYSQRHFSFLDAGGTSTVLNDSPIFTLTQNGGNWEYNAPYFDATDPEDRNNRQLTANLSYSLTKAGRHDLKAGWEWYRSARTGGNSQSATSYVFVSDFVPDASGNPVFDANDRIIPTFVPGDTQVQHWLATRGAQLNTDNNSVFVQDHWVATTALSFDLGVRCREGEEQLDRRYRGRRYEHRRAPSCRSIPPQRERQDRVPRHLRLVLGALQRHAGWGEQRRRQPGADDRRL